MKTKILFLITLILFGTLLFSNVFDRDLPINEWDMIKKTIDTKANGDSLNCTLMGRALFGISLNVFVKDTIAYSCHGISLLIFNIKDPSNPILLGYYDTGSTAEGVFVVDSFAYVVDFHKLIIVNVSNPAAPVETGFYYTSSYVLSLFVIDSFAYIADGGAGLRIINVSEPAVPVETGFYDTGGDA
ncbi:hypothetical protein KAU15_05895, partial [candidate division WOR-3 bacterium]|nr:hypothetical protein [candidate division WOR-3 bacterium]